MLLMFPWKTMVSKTLHRIFIYYFEDLSLVSRDDLGLGPNNVSLSVSVTTLESWIKSTPKNKRKRLNFLKENVQRWLIIVKLCKFLYKKYFFFHSTAKWHGYLYSLQSFIRQLGLTDVKRKGSKPRKSTFLFPTGWFWSTVVLIFCIK